MKGPPASLPCRLTEFIGLMAPHGVALRLAKLATGLNDARRLVLRGA
jgi:hypothetical protein